MAVSVRSDSNLDTTTTMIVSDPVCTFTRAFFLMMPQDDKLRCGKVRPRRP